MQETNLKTIHFEPINDSHFDQLFEWLSLDHVSQWWGEPKQELELIKQSYISGKEQGYIIHISKKPIGYIQAWNPLNYDEEEWLQLQTEGTVGIDVFIGDQAFLGKGFGAEILKNFCKRLYSNGAKRIIIDPDPLNQRAIRAYSKAGFEHLQTYHSSAGDTFLMQLNNKLFGQFK